jgi:hypothetical protein
MALNQFASRVCKHVSPHFFVYHHSDSVYCYINRAYPHQRICGFYADSNEAGQVLSHCFTGLAEEAEERAPQTNELFDRYVEFGCMESTTDEDGKVVLRNAPVFIEDKCCQAAAHLREPLGKWGANTPRADEYHLTDRIMDPVKATQEDHGKKAKITEMRKQVQACFADVKPGIYESGDAIIAKLRTVCEIFKSEKAGGLWCQKVEKQFQNTVPHILNCLALPSHIKPYLRDRTNKITLKRGTNGIESLWRYRFIICITLYMQYFKRFSLHYIIWFRWLLRYFPEVLSLSKADPLLKCLLLEGNISRMVDYDKRWPDIMIPFWLVPDLLLIASMSEKAGIVSPIPKLRLVDRDWSKVSFGWAASTAFCDSLKKNKHLTTKPAAEIPPEAEYFLAEEILQATGDSNTHLYPLRLLEEEIDAEFDESSSSSRSPRASPETAMSSAVDVPASLMKKSTDGSSMVISASHEKDTESATTTVSFAASHLEVETGIVSSVTIQSSEVEGSTEVSSSVTIDSFIPTRPDAPEPAVATVFTTEVAILHNSPAPNRGTRHHPNPLVHFTSPRTPLERKNKPAGALLPSGRRVQKLAHHSNKGSAKSHRKNRRHDEVSAKHFMCSYPTSAEFHNMHGDILMFTKTMYPIERQLLKMLILKMTGETKLSEVKLVKEQHKQQLHKVQVYLQCSD